jgi:hypothetical protein
MSARGAGQFNAIIPVVDGKLTESYWGLMQLVDTELLYAYCDLAPGEARASGARLNS